MKRLLILVVASFCCLFEPEARAAVQATVGQAAPDFTLLDTRGQARSRTKFQGQFVVLEWFNNDCPFVRKQYGTGAMQRLQATYTERGVVWLTIASSAVGKQGHLTPEQGNAVIHERKAHQTALLLDPHGVVGRLYDAKTTPSMVVIDPKGLVVYTGAIDDRPSVDPADVAAAHNYVASALDEAMAGKSVSVSQTRSYGCSVKYQ